jgi:8-oxo-dGTP pyrophosphatase MutT (NUDIX family)
MANTRLPQFTVNPNLIPFSINLQTYLASNPTISRLVVSAVVVHAPDMDTTPRALLVQRAASDGFPLQWECPGGSVDYSDSTILHALQRELLEETGLDMVHADSLLDGSVEFAWGKGVCRKLTFLVHVGTDGNGAVPGVLLNAEEHHDFMWASREEVECRMCEGREIRLAYETTREILLRGLRYAPE